MLKNKTVFISGASSGIGKACAHAFAAQGASLILCARRESLLTTMAKELQTTYHVPVYTLILDVQNRKAVKEEIDVLQNTCQKIDFLVNNAGLAAGLDFFQDASIDDWEAMIDTNVKGLLYLTKAILPGMISHQSGHIINISSIAGDQTYPKGHVYCASKAAVNVISQGLRMDLLGNNIRVTTVSPGAVETNFSVVRFKGDTEKAKQVYEGYQPLSPEDVADAVIYAATRKPHVNIAEIVVMPTAQAAFGMIAKQ